MPAMRSVDEIVRAHDLLVGLILDDDLRAMVINLEDDQALREAASILCWVLRHDHNQKFAGNLASIEARLEALGVRLEEREC